MKAHTLNWDYSYNFASPVDIQSLAAGDELIANLINSRAFQRLKQIRFLGGIDYLVIRAPNGVRGNIRYSRYEHSLGVARLASSYSNQVSLSNSNRRLACIAALLHDVGHAPFSHSLEPVFKEKFELDHHAATRQVLTGQVPIGRQIVDLLREKGIDIERLMAIIFGEDDPYQGFFSGPINFDTIEGILRAQAYAKRGPEVTSPEVVLNASIERATDRDKAAVDQFWAQKDQVYRHLINSRVGVLADLACQTFMRANIDHLAKIDYFATETEMFRKLEGLRDLLASISFESEMANLVERPISYKVRRFFVDEKGDFFSREDSRRYRQTKIECTFPALSPSAKAPVEIERDLFDDERHRTSEAALRNYA